MSPTTIPAASCRRRTLLGAGLTLAGLALAGLPVRAEGNASAPPAARRTVGVANDRQLAAALAEAQPGDHILLAAGVYEDDHRLAASGTEAAPIVIRPAEPHQAVFAGTLQLAGRHGWAHGLKLVQDAAYALQLKNDHASITRCWFAGARGILITTQKHWRIGYNKFTGHPVGGERCDHIYVKVPAEGADLPDHGRIYRNHFTHVGRKDRTESHHVYVGDTWTDYASSPSFEDLVIEHNLVDNSSRRRGIYVKRGCTIQFNHVVMTRGACLIRGGENGKVWGNRLIGMDSCVINGRNHDIRGNYWRDTRFELMSQHLSRTGNRYIAADNALLVGNDGDLVLGELPKSGKLLREVSGVRIYRHQGEIIRMAAAEDMQRAEAAAQLWYPAPVSLSPRDVGPDAA